MKSIGLVVTTAIVLALVVSNSFAGSIYLGAGIGSSDGDTHVHPPSQTAINCLIPLATARGRHRLSRFAYSSCIFFSGSSFRSYDCSIRINRIS